MAAEDQEHRRQHQRPGDGAAVGRGERLVARIGPLQAEAEGERRGQQEVRVPERVLEQAVHADHQHHHEGGALDGA